MNSYKKLNLITEEGQHFYYRDDLLSTNIDELEEFLEIFKNINNLDFVKKVLFSHELQANNLVEGYGDDLAIIESVIKRKTSQIKDENQKKRIYCGAIWYTTSKRTDVDNSSGFLRDKRTENNIYFY